LLVNGSIKNVTAATNTLATIEELLDESFFHAVRIVLKATSSSQTNAWEYNYPVPGGNKYRNLAHQVVGVSIIETVKYGHKYLVTLTRERLR
jgi:hypothetical protein